MDHNNVITMPGYDKVEIIATELAWNGLAYECYLCEKEFSSLHGLNNHIKSPAHEQDLYHCPKASCRKTYKVLSGLIQHMESESCGVMRFSQIQNRARNGVYCMVGRMIMN
jgi:hypothetical protein